MKITKIELKNFRGFRHVEIDLHKNLTLLVGINGAGKTSCLDAVVIFLSGLIASIQQKRSNFKIQEKDVRQGSKENCSLTIKTEDPDFSALFVKEAPFGPKLLVAGLKQPGYVDYLNILIQQIADTSGNTNIPVFAYYSPQRTVLDVPLRIRKKQEFQLLEAYESSLGSGANFRSFFEWFRNREDFENEQKVQQLEKHPTEPLFQDRQLQAVRQAIELFMPGFTQLRVRRNPLRMTVDKEGKTFEINQLSEGEKVTLAMVGDLARRFAIANPLREKPLEGEGIVLIDEIELHLHPGWQKDLTKKFQATFPNCQFLVTTHSPQTIGDLPHDQIRILTRNEQGEIQCETPDQSLGLSTNEILDELMGVSPVESGISRKLKELNLEIDQENWDRADQLMKELLEKTNGWIPELRKAEALIGMLRPE